jgi:hypothetical protein
MLRGGGAASRSTAIPVRATMVCSHPVPQKWRPRRRGGHASDLWVPSRIAVRSFIMKTHSHVHSNTQS